MLGSVADAGTERFLAFVRSGDRAGMEALLQEQRPTALARARGILGNAADAEDAVQDAFLRLMRDHTTYDGSVPFAAWLARLVHCASQDLKRSTVRRRRREREAVAIGPAEPEPAAADEERMRRVRHCVEELPDELRTPIELHFFQGLSQQVVAERLGVGESAIAMRIQRAKRRLRARMAQQGILLTAEVLDAHLRAGASLAGDAMRIAASTGAAHLKTTVAWCLAALLLLPITGWAVWRSLRPTLPAPPPMAAGVSPVATPPAAATPPARMTARTPATTPQRLYSWHFDDGPPSDMRVTKGAWRYLPKGGVHDSGCMEIDSDAFVATIQHPMPAGPLLVSLSTSPRTGIPSNFQLLVVWEDVTYDYEVLNIGRPEPLSFPRGAEYHAYVRIRDYLGTDSHDSWYGNRRSVLQFLGAVPGGAMKLVAIGRQRIDDITIDRIDPRALPDVSPVRRAVFAVPRERRRGITLLPGVTGLDPQHPAGVHWWLSAPDAPYLPH